MSLTFFQEMHSVRVRRAGVAGGEPETAGSLEGRLRVVMETGVGALSGELAGGCSGLQPFFRCSGGAGGNKEQLLFCLCPSRWWCQPGPRCQPARSARAACPPAPSLQMA